MINSPLHTLLQNLSVNPEKPKLVVFDLDSTIFCVSPRTQFILRELGQSQSFQQKAKSLAQVLANIEVRPSDWGVKQAIERTGLSVKKELQIFIRDYWRARFFSNEYLVHDRIYPGARDFVLKVAKTGAEVRYLTGRGDAGMRRGTELQLHHHQLPLTSPQHLVMKPSENQKGEMSDEGFKVRVLKNWLTQFEGIWFLDNEPVILHQTEKELPDVQLIFVDTVHAGRAANPTHLPSITEESYLLLKDFPPGEAG